MAVNVDILNVNELYINGVNLLEGKRDYIQLVGDEKVVINVPTGSTTYSKVIPQIGVNLGDVELKTTPLDGKTFDSINNAGGISVDGVSHIVDVNGCYVSNINIDSFVLNKTSVIKSLDYTTYKWYDVDYGRYDLALSCDNLDIISLPTPISEYNFDNNLLDNMSNHNATSYNVITYENGKKNKCVVTNGVDSYIDTNYMTSTTQGSLTTSFFVYVDSLTSSIGTIYGTSEYTNIFCQILSDHFSIASLQSTLYYFKKTSLVIGWNHIVVHHTSTPYIYVNNIKYSHYATNNSIGVNVSRSLWIGRMIGYYSSVKLDCLKLFNRELTQAEISALFDEFNLIDLNTTDFQTGTASYEFNGTNYITIPSNPKYALGTDDFTIELYTKVTYLDATYGAYIIENRTDGGEVGDYCHYSLRMNTDGRILLQIKSTSGLINMMGNTNQFNKWCHISLVRSSGVIKLYVNGIEESSYNTPLNFTRDTFNIGRGAYGSGFLIGFIDDLRITKGLARYTTNFTPSTTLDTGTRPVKVAQHQGTVIQSELSYSDYLVSYGAEIDPWVAVQPSITVSGEPFTTAVTTITSSSTFTSAETFNIGDIISSDKETFGTVIFEENGEFMVDADIFFDGVTDKPFTPSDANIVNFVKDKRSNLYTNGLRDALLSSVSSTIYGHINDEIIVDAGEGGSFILGTMYTSGGYQDTDTTSKFSISLSNDGVDYTVVYENQENLMTNHAHNMTGTGRFIKITFLNEIGSWGRIITNFVGGKWWDLHIVHPMSKVYRYAARLEVNGKSIVPNYIQWFDNMTINKIVCDKVFINPTTVLNINTENISKVELDLWQEVKGVI